MDALTQMFCKIIRQRSAENRQAIESMSVHLGGTLSPAFSVLRQELDSMVRVVFLLSIDDLCERRRLIRTTLDGQKWRVVTSTGKWRTVTDREMSRPFSAIAGLDMLSVQVWMRFHSFIGPPQSSVGRSVLESCPKPKSKPSVLTCVVTTAGHASDDLTLDEFVRYIPAVFEKIQEIWKKCSCQRPRTGQENGARRVGAPDGES